MRMKTERERIKEREDKKRLEKQQQMQLEMKNALHHNQPKFYVRLGLILLPTLEKMKRAKMKEKRKKRGSRDDFK